MVRIGGHDVPHVLPPFLAFGGLGNGLPAGLVLDLRVGEELAGLGMEKNGGVVDPVFFQDDLQFRPNGAVPLFALFFLTGVHRHHEGFADFHDSYF